MIRMRAPEGMSSFSHQGFPIEIDGDGVAMVDDRHQGDLETHGFSLVPRGGIPPALPKLTEQEAEAVSMDTMIRHSGDMRRDDALKRIVMLPVETLELLADIAEGKTPSEPAADVKEQPAPEIPEVPPASVVGKLSDDEIGRMSKPKLMEYCKAHGIPAIPPIDVDELRAKVRHANAAA